MITVCICTRDRPEPLRIALGSIAASEIPVDQVIVSDDGDPGSTATAEVCEAFARVTYACGPRRGLCANRNAALEHVDGDVVLFLDDDAAILPDFFSRIEKARSRSTDREHLIVTGSELRQGFVIVAHEQTFLGFQAAPYDGRDVVRTIVMNATVFPTGLFQRVRFDERLAYGYDEVDLATRAVAAGYRIEICAEALVEHSPSPVHRGANESYIDASRLYVTAKRYAFTERRPLKAAGFFACASAHVLAAGLRDGGLAGLRRGMASIVRAAQDIADFQRTSRTT
jgi:glycosyltransferase involved in cell wall biosynthesis